MSQDKELEIQSQFLDEAQEYVKNLEAILLEVAHRGIDIDQINGALRATHSIKGGASLMGFATLSQLAHQLEDSFKVLKVQRHHIEIDADLERLLLACVDGLQQVIAHDRHTLAQGQPPNTGYDPDWLANQVRPPFDQLYQRLGEPPDEDASSLLSLDEGQDITPLLFQTEVEGCLQRLETALAEQAPCLREEVEILAQELEGLGEMLQLEAFAHLCRSITYHMGENPDRTLDIAEMALQAWRRSQALVLTGHLENLPTAIEPSEPLISTHQPVFDLTVDSSEAAPLDAVDPALLDSLSNLSDPLLLDVFHEVTDLPETEQGDQPTAELISPEWLESGSSNASFGLERQVVQPIAPTPIPAINRSRLPVRDIPAADFRGMGEGSDNRSEAAPDLQENTVRVPLKQLDQLNDLFGELIIERNGLELNLKRFRDLLQSLNQRVQTLEQSNARLRNAYDKGSFQTAYETKGTNALLRGDLQNAIMISPDTYGRYSLTNSSPLEWGGFDALEMDQYSDLHLLSQEVMETIVQIQEVMGDADLGLEDAEQTSRDLKKTARQLQTKLTQLRMRPLSDICDRFPRALRELSLQYGKQVQLKLEGGNTLIDRNILEALNDPLMHLLRNAFDHGIERPEIRQAQGKPEQGVIEIRAWHHQNRTYITVRDDGGGIPLDKIQKRAQEMGLDESLLAVASEEDLLSLIFEPGFSTAEQVTALSGRGVGMDVVRNNLKQVRGDVKVETQAGLGTTFTISVPFTLSVARVLIAESNGMLLAFPTDAIEETLILNPEKIITLAGNEVFDWEGTVVQLVRLSSWLTFRCPKPFDTLETPPAVAVPTVFMVNQRSQFVGLQVDKCWGEQEVAIRRVEGNLSMPPGFDNCTILGDGRVVPLVNPSELLRWIAGFESVPTVPDTPLPSLPGYEPPLLNSAEVDSRYSGAGTVTSASDLRYVPLPPVAQQPTILIVDDSINVRRLLALTLEKAGYLVIQAKDGQEALDQLTTGLQVHAVICDIEMPRLDGYGLLARLKSSADLKHIPIAMLTSRSSPKHQQLAMNLGAVAYFSKPYNEQMLLQTMERLINLVPTA